MYTLTLCYYFGDLVEIFSPSSLWCKYSMLKKISRLNKNINIVDYHKLGEHLN